uniref:Homeobox domain-containing protein n=1 Tax=Ciona savignyi TaxID=51511 RepID=H2ZH44_CIOSA
MYMQGLMGDKEQNVTDKIMEDKRAANDWSNSLDKTAWNGNQQWMKPNHVDTKSFNHVRRVSEDKSGTVRSRLVTPPMGGTKRKLSTSPTLSQSSSSSASPSLVQNSMMRHKGSFMDERDSMGKDPKRLRTTITPEQLEYLYQQYLVDSSPSRKIIEQISEAVGLKKRVVQ